MRSDTQLDKDWELVKAAIKRVQAGNMPSRDKVTQFFGEVEVLLEEIGVSGDDAVTLMFGMAFAYAESDHDRQEPATPEKET